MGEDKTTTGEASADKPSVYTVEAHGHFAARVPTILEMIAGTGNWKKTGEGVYEIPVTATTKMSAPLLAQAIGRLEGVNLVGPGGEPVQAGTGAFPGAPPKHAQNAAEGPVPVPTPSAPLTKEQKIRRNVMRGRGRYARRTGRYSIRPLGMGGPQYVVRWGRVKNARAWTVDIRTNEAQKYTRIGFVTTDRSAGLTRKGGYYRAVDIVAAHVKGDIRPEHGIVEITAKDYAPWQTVAEPVAEPVVVVEDETEIEFSVVEVSDVPALDLLKRVEIEDDPIKARRAALEAQPYNTINKLCRQLDLEVDNRKKTTLIDALIAWEFST